MAGPRSPIWLPCWSWSAFLPSSDVREPLELDEAICLSRGLSVGGLSAGARRVVGLHIGEAGAGMTHLGFHLFHPQGLAELIQLSR